MASDRQLRYSEMKFGGLLFFSLKSLLDESRCGRLSVYRRTAKILIKKTIYSFPLFTSDEFFWSFYGLLSGFAVFN